MIVNNKKYKCYMTVNTDPTIHNDLKQHWEDDGYSFPNGITKIADWVYASTLTLTSFEGEVIIPSTVVTIGNSSFKVNKKITSLIIPDSVISIGTETFATCIELGTVTLGNSLEELGSYCFSNCPKLTEITIPSSMKKIGSGCFNRCTALETIVINKPQDSISGAPWGATNATVVWYG